MALKTNITYSNEYETYIIKRCVISGKVEWRITQDDIFSNEKYKTLKAAKKAIDNQEVYF